LKARGGTRESARAAKESEISVLDWVEALLLADLLVHETGNDPFKHLIE
jgi:hypothetical protein